MELMKGLLAAVEFFPALWESVWPLTWAYFGLEVTFFCKIYQNLIVKLLRAYVFISNLILDILETLFVLFLLH